MSEPWPEIRQALETALGESLGDLRPQSVGGGHINMSWLIHAEDGCAFFVKTNSAFRLDLLEAEREGLRELASAGAIRTPFPLAVGSSGHRAFLILEALDLGGPPSWGRLGEQLARLHRVTSPDNRYGWRRDNYIGSTPQPNAWREDWGSFFAARLEFQFQRAVQKGHPFPGMDRFLARVPDLANSHKPAASLLHGDLWSGNANFDLSGEPVVYDPAVYFGDRETDLAFTRLFGDFPAEFYDAYNAAWPVADGFEDRIDVYNVYHLLNHYNIFGGTYGEQAQNIVRRLA